MTQSLAEMLSAEVVDLTQPLAEDTPGLEAPAPVREHAGASRP